MNRMIRIGLRLFHIVGMAAFVGSVLAMIILARSHDFSGDWGQIAVARADVLRITRYATLPGLGLIVLTGLLLLGGRVGPLLRQRIMRIKLALVALLVLNTTILVVPTVARLALLAEAAVQSPAAQAAFLAVHWREDVFGALNLLLLLLSAFLGLRLTGAGPARTAVQR